jgi:hypothetical protein
MNRDDIAVSSDCGAKRVGVLPPVSSEADFANFCRREPDPRGLQSETSPSS